MGTKSHLMTERKKTFLLMFILILILILGFITRLHSVIKFESLIHEFDPWFNYRATKMMVENTFYDFINWFDDSAWYPLGRDVGGTVYPGLMATSGLLHWLLQSLSLPVHIREVCVFLPAFYSGFMSLTAFLFSAELWNKSAGLIAAFIMSIVPGYVSRSVAGSYDYECISIFILMFNLYLWAKTVQNGSLLWAVLTAFFYLYMVASWGGYIYVINVIPLHVFILLLCGRYTPKLFCAYTTFYVLGLLMSMQIPFVGFLPLTTSEHMASLLTFLLLCAFALFQHVGSLTNSRLAAKLLLVSLAISALVAVVLILLLTYAGVISPWTGRLYNLFDTSYAAIHIPIITSVAEHQISVWTRYFIDLHFLPAVLPFGVWLCFSRLSDQMMLMLTLAVTSAYFSGMMVRLVIILTPITAIVTSFALESILRGLARCNRKGKEGFFAVSLSSMSLLGVISLFVVHSTWITAVMYSGTSIVIEGNSNTGSRILIDDFREAYYWLNKNTPKDSKIMSWWDYGYQITGFSNRTTIVDNNTWNNTHIAIVGKAMSSNESRAVEIMRELDVDYVLVVFGGYVGYDSDDIAKFLWMVRISEGEFPNEIHENQYMDQNGVYNIGHGVSETMKSSLMFKLSYYRFQNMHTNGYDKSRQTSVGHRVDKLTHMEEAFTSGEWIVRIYRVKDNCPRVRLSYKPLSPIIVPMSKKTSSWTKGTIHRVKS